MNISDRIKSRPDLKSYFVKNAIPTESNFADLIDSVPNQREDGLVKAAGAPLSIEASGDASSQKRALNFYWDFTEDKPHWVLSLNPRATPANAGTAKPGFSISDPDGNSRLFIDRATGNLGVATVNPATKLDIAGGRWNLQTTEGDFRVGNGQFRFKLGVALGGAGRGDVRLRAQGGTNRLMLGSGTADVLTVRDGKVGIGTSNPAETLDVNGRTKSGALSIGPWPANPNGYVFFGSNAIDQAAAQNYALLQARTGGRTYLNSPVDIRFRIGNSDKMVLLNNGRIGIGTSTPSATLDVKGTIRADAIKTTLYTSGGTAARALAKTNQWNNFPDLARNFTLKGASNVLVFYQVTMPGGDSHLVTRLVVDNAVQRHGRSITGNTTYWSNSNIWIGGLSKGSHTIKVQYRTPKGGTNSPAANWQNRVLKVLVFGA